MQDFREDTRVTRSSREINKGTFVYIIYVRDQHNNNTILTEIRIKETDFRGLKNM